MNLNLVTLLVFLSVSSIIAEDGKIKTIGEKCTVCKALVATFKRELIQTNKGNFGGGNTDWEDKKLGSYLTSETRFEEIIEKLCEKKEHDCNKIKENEEDLLLDLFQNRQNELDDILENELCVNKLKYCCPSGTVGPDCSPCTKIKFDKICSGNGHCEGNGKRDGKNRCVCNRGYVGELCDNCSSSHYVISKSDRFLKCDKCSEKCRTCVDKTKCLTCHPGYKLEIEDQTCEDVNECEDDPNICGENKVCVNTEGKYACNGEDESEDKDEDEMITEGRRRKINLIKRSIIIGVAVLCAFCSYLSRQYVMFFVSVSVGIFLIYLSN